MKSDNQLQFLALGGSGEIGMNVNLYGTQGKWVMVDCGMTFSNGDYPGIDLVLPDLSFIEDRLDDLTGIVLTHGHEDHIGALRFFAEDLGVPLYATPFTAGLIAEKLKEDDSLASVELNIVEVGGSIELGPFAITFVPLAHSIPEANALLIKTDAGTVFHSGDWKTDAEALLGEPTTIEELTAIGDGGVTALVCDSTNVFNEAESGTEQSVRAGLEEQVRKAKGRVVVTTFASNAMRLHTLGEVAKATGRTVTVAGRSLDRILRVAKATGLRHRPGPVQADRLRELAQIARRLCHAQDEVAKATGYLRQFPEPISWDAAIDLAPSKLLVIATGGQGEPRAALGRMAEGSHPIKLDKGDTVLFSARQIPGNENAVAAIQNKLAAQGVVMVTDRQANIHVSGHPGRPELKAMYEALRPDILIPVHGERRHLEEQARFAKECGIPHALVQVSGQAVRLAPGAPKIVGQERVGRLVLDGDVILPADGSTINERRRIAERGTIAVALAVDKSGRLAGQPSITMQGVPLEEDRDDFLQEAGADVQRTVGKGRSSAKELSEKVRLAVRRTATRWTGKKPIVDVMVLEV